MKKAITITAAISLVLLSALIPMFKNRTPAVHELGASLVEGSNCKSCHGQNGISASGEYPSLAGQSKDYLAKRLKYLRDNTTAIKSIKNDQYFPPEMIESVSQLTDEQIHAIALYYSQLPGMHQQVK